jgi:hypothetical protein
VKEERMSVYDSEIVPGAKVTFWVDPAREDGGPRDEWIGPFGTREEAKAKQYELYGSEPSDDPWDYIEMDDPKFPLFCWEYTATAREVLPLEKLVGVDAVRSLVADLRDVLDDHLDRDFRGQLVGIADGEWPEPSDDAVKRVTAKLVVALREEGLDLPDILVTWSEY